MNQWCWEGERVLLNEKGQLLLPILAVLFLFGLFWVPYVVWCEKTYWSMRMAAAADLAALSGAREQARLLNFMGSLQMLQTMIVTQVKGVGTASLQAKPSFDALNAALQLTHASIRPRLLAVANVVAKINGSNRPVIPGFGASWATNGSSKLSGHSLKVIYVAPGAPPLPQEYPRGYFVRTWAPRTLKAQPDHEQVWLVCHGSECSEGRAGLWLDVAFEDRLNNGGFPSENASLLRSVGFQCFYPQFNARLLPKR